MSNQEQVELETVQVEHYVEMGEALDRLEQNEDFKKVIIEGYLKANVLDSVSLLAVPQIKKAGERTDVMEDLIAASNLQYFLQTVHQFHAAQKDPILSEEEEAALEEAQAEGGIQ